MSIDNLAEQAEQILGRIERSYSAMDYFERAKEWVEYAVKNSGKYDTRKYNTKYEQVTEQVKRRLGI